MPVILGIDEAGYGPLLGPLLVGGSLWRVDSRHAERDYWDLLDDCVVRSAPQGDWRLAVDDSKAVFDRKVGLTTLERSVLAFAAAAPQGCGTLLEFLAGLGADPAEVSAAMPWYRDLGAALPVDPKRSKFEAVSERLRRQMKRAGVQCIGLRARVVTEEEYNRKVAAIGNKGTLLLEPVLNLIHEAGKAAGTTDLIVRVDRLGGRTDYREVLSAAFPERHLHVLEITDGASRYRLASQRNDWFIEFLIDGDKRHMPIALASMVAKYVRELLMNHFNAYWKQWLPELAPTAGYRNDAHRFLSDIGPIVARAGIPPQRFVRLR